MFQWRSLPAFRLAPLLSMTPRGVGHEPPLPMPSLLTQTPPTTEASEVSAPPSQPSESHVALRRLWQFITFRQPPDRVSVRMRPYPRPAALRRLYVF